eukprot:6625613-Ditylum_brightwellii.AAC.1
MAFGLVHTMGNGDDDEKIEETMSCVCHPVASSMEIQIINSTVVQCDKSKMVHFSDNLTACIERARKNLPIKVSFDTSNVDLKEDMMIIERGRLSAASNTANMKKLKYHHEKRMSCAIAKKRLSNNDEF